jgi:hypothetical protein
MRVTLLSVGSSAPMPRLPHDAYYPERLALEPVDDPHMGADDANLDGERGRRGGREPARQIEQVQRARLRRFDDRAAIDGNVTHVPMVA